jgi:glycosyltransferase involved in cell wall biosynthesis
MHSATLLLTTYRRPAILRRTLEAMTKMDVTGLSYQIVVVDNCGDEATQSICKEYCERIPVIPLVCVRPGKNAALNFGLDYAVGELVVFTDDDVLPAPNWLNEVCFGVARWPTHVLFAGRVLPEWPSTPPDYVLDVIQRQDLGRWTYSIIDPALAEGPSDKMLPIGNNMAVRRTIFDRGMRFDESIGPRGSSYAMGSETEFNLRLRQLGHNAVWLPNALVYHQIRSEQLTKEWLLSRAFREGRGEIRLRRDKSLYSLLRMAKAAAISTGRCYAERLRGENQHSFFSQIDRSLATGRLSEALRLRFGGA